MDLLRNIKIFKRVAEASSFTAAARQLEITTAQASRAISELEVHLRTRLLHRTTRRVAMTEAGNQYLQRCDEICSLIDLSEDEVRSTQSLPAGVLRIHAPLSFGQTYVVPALVRYLEAYPGVRADLTLSQETPDLIDEGFDVTLRITSTQLPDSALVSTRICTMPSVLCASPAYVEREGTPEKVDDLAAHACLQLVTPYLPVSRWHFVGPDGATEIDLPPGRLRLNSPEALASALAYGAGIGPLPMPSAVPLLTSGKLVRVLPEFELQSMTIYAMYASRKYLDAKIKAWVECLRAYVAQEIGAGRI
ncbi:LysR family transcriptional regulator [Paraburkholderia sp. Cy-641]|uniref:LysR family transcriptional regulator n=1 Tax=Paraburkholderia sp. Cy-641 TaxID=2608337 RepID=UPI00141E6321|nr:LysR family transcriptional regulator [Paraburkholderia sp. Cy-641]NIF77312.1 LysR family transcriptional regulator [Paraburkholderia sp. Cy-641]